VDLLAYRTKRPDGARVAPRPWYLVRSKRGQADAANSPDSSGVSGSALPASLHARRIAPPVPGAGKRGRGSTGLRLPVRDQSLLCDLAIAMTSLNTPCPASCGPAPGPMIVTSPIGLAPQTTALVVPSTFASGSSR
jgi:hypothetical protein